MKIEFLIENTSELFNVHVTSISTYLVPGTLFTRKLNILHTLQMNVSRYFFSIELGQLSGFC